MFFNIRSGVALLMRFLRLLRSNPSKAISIENLVAEDKLIFRAEAVRFGLFGGMFAFLFRSASSLTKLVLARNSSKVPSLVGGFVAGGALTFMSKDWHRTLSLYVATRALECAYNVMKTKGFFKGISMYHGDALLFAVSSAQVMYSYVMRKETLPKSYHRFIVRQGPVDKEILSAVCANNRGLPLNLEELRAYVQAKGVLRRLKGYLLNSLIRSQRMFQLLYFTLTEYPPSHTRQTHS